MKIVNLSLVLTLMLISNNLLSQSAENQSINEFATGQIKKFDTYGEGKSLGLKIHLKYPKSWKSIEGEHPHVIRKFVQSDNSVLSILILTMQQDKFPQNEINEILTPQGIKSIMPIESMFISSNCNLKIEGIRAGSIEFYTKGYRIDNTFLSYNMNYILFWENYSVAIQFMVVKKQNESEEEVQVRYEKIKPLFYKMFNSLVIDNIWYK